MFLYCAPVNVDNSLMYLLEGEKFDLSQAMLVVQKFEY